MNKYKVVFHYSIDINAEDEETAQDLAWSAFGNPDLNNDYFSITIQKKETE